MLKAEKKSEGIILQKMPPAWPAHSPYKNQELPLCLAGAKL